MPTTAEAIAAIRANRLAEAQTLAKAVLQADPQDHVAWQVLGVSHVRLGQMEEGIRMLEKALFIRPDYVQGWVSLGNAFQALNHHEDAIERYDKALVLRPADANARCYKALSLLCLGRYREGWPLYESRLLIKKEHAVRDFDRVLWLGSQPIAGRHLLVQFEQGLGDAIHMLRYVPLLEGLGARCCIQATASLTALVQRSFPQARIVPRSECPEDIEFRIPMASLPLAFRTHAEADIPAQVPYLVADEARTRRWTSRLAAAGKRLVGLTWRGNPKHGNDRNRSISLAALIPLFARKDTHFVTLQKDLTDEESALLSRHVNVTVLDRELTTIDETAAVMSALDLVVCVDSAPAHLAGALGRKTWILLPFSPDWRWQLERTDSPWYPTARLFRQPTHGDWAGVLHSVEASLDAL